MSCRSGTTAQGVRATVTSGDALRGNSANAALGPVTQIFATQRLFKLACQWLLPTTLSGLMGGRETVPWIVFRCYSIPARRAPSLIAASAGGFVTG